MREVSPISAEAFIVLTLAMEPTYGAAIFQKIAVLSDMKYHLAEGSMAVHLRRLAKLGLAERLEVHNYSKAGGRPAVYRLTPKGYLKAREYRQFFLRLCLTECKGWR